MRVVAGHGQRTLFFLGILGVVRPGIGVSVWSPRRNEGQESEDGCDPLHAARLALSGQRWQEVHADVALPCSGLPTHGVCDRMAMTLRRGDTTWRIGTRECGVTP